MKLKANGIDINYSVEGEGPWVVLSHSVACNLSMWDEQAGALAQKFRVLRYDTRGHGGSDAPEGEYSFDQLADDAKGLLDVLGIRSCHWVGLSLGGMIGQFIALKYPGVLKTLVLCDTTSRQPPESRPAWMERIGTVRGKGMEAVVEPTLARWFTEPFRNARKDALERVSKMIRGTPVAGYVGCAYAIPTIDVTARLGEIACSSLVIVGEQDMATTVAMARTIQEGIRGAELAVIPSAAHLSNIEQPEAFNRALLAFLSRHR